MRTGLPGCLAMILLLGACQTAPRTSASGSAAAAGATPALQLDSIAILTLELARGTWDSNEGDSTCLGNTHDLSFSPDFRTMTFTFRSPIDTETGERVVNYRVLAVGGSIHPTRPYTIRAAMEGETRRTDAGELVVWDLMLATPDRYHWHRTDWEDLAVTEGRVRCVDGRPRERLSTPPEEVMAIGQQVSARYDSAFSALTALARRDSVQFSWLLELAEFKRQHVGWGVENNGSLRAVTPARMDAWLVVVPEGDPAYARMSSILEADLEASVRATRVKSDTIAPAWAAIFLGYELSHIRDHVLKLIPPKAKPAQLAASSRRAYGAEYQGVRLMGGPAVEAHMDSVLAALAPKSVTALAESLLPVIRESFDRFDALVTAQPPLTEREGQRRAGVYAISLLLRFSEKNAISDEDFAAALSCIGGC